MLAVVLVVNVENLRVGGSVGRWCWLFNIRNLRVGSGVGCSVG